MTNACGLCELRPGAKHDLVQLMHHKPAGGSMGTMSFKPPTLCSKMLPAKAIHKVFSFLKAYLVSG